MSKEAFFTAPDLDDDKIIVPAVKTISNKPVIDHIPVPDEAGENFFVSTELDGSPKRVPVQGKPQRTNIKGSVTDVPGELSDDLRKRLTDKLLSNSSTVTVKNVVVDSSKERVIARFVAPSKNISCDIELPLDITANDLVVGLNEAYKLGIDISDIRQCYLSCENPVALLKGKRQLGEFGIRDGSLITYYR